MKQLLVNELTKKYIYAFLQLITNDDKFGFPLMKSNPV